MRANRTCPTPSLHLGSPTLPYLLCRRFGRSIAADFSTDKINNNIWYVLDVSTLDKTLMHEYLIFLLTHGTDSDPHATLIRKKRRAKSSKSPFPFKCDKIQGCYALIRRTNSYFQGYLSFQIDKSVDRELGIQATPSQYHSTMLKERSSRLKKGAEKAKKDKSRVMRDDDRKKTFSKNQRSQQVLDDRDIMSLESESIQRKKNASRKGETYFLFEGEEVDEGFLLYKLKKQREPLDTTPYLFYRKKEIVKESKKILVKIPPKTHKKKSGDDPVPNSPSEGIFHPKVRKSGYTKQETQEFRDSKTEVKNAARARRQAARAARNNPIVVESGEILCESDDDEAEDDSLMDIIISTIKDSFDDISSNTFRIVNLVYQLYRSRSYLDYVSAIYAFTGEKTDTFLGITAASLKKLVTENLSSFLQWSKSCFKTQAGEDESTTMDGVSDMLQSILSCQLFNVLRDFFLSAASTHWFGEDFSKRIFTVVGNQKTSFINLLVTLTDGCKKLWHMYNNWWNEGMSFSEAFLSPDPYIVLIRQARNLLPFKDQLYTGLPQDGFRDRVTFIKELKGIIDTMNHFSSKISTKASYYPDFYKVKIECEVTYNSLLASVGPNSRSMPACIIVVGPPGIGKSHMMTYIMQVWSRTKGREYSDNLVYSKSDPKYFEGHFPLQQPYITFSEVGHLSKEMTLRVGDVQLDSLLSLIDTRPYLLPMAFSRKGEVFAQPELVMADTNNESMHIPEQFSTPNAYYRRMDFVEMSVLPKFRKTDSVEIDANLSAQADGHALDRYYIKYYKMRYDRGNFERTTLCETESLSVFTDFLSGHFQSFLATTLKSKDMFDHSNVFEMKVESGECPSPVGVSAQEIELDTKIGDEDLNSSCNPRETIIKSRLTDKVKIERKEEMEYSYMYRFKKKWFPDSTVSKKDSSIKEVELPDPKNKFKTFWWEWIKFVSSFWNYVIYSLAIVIFTDVNATVHRFGTFNWYRSLFFYVIYSSGLLSPVGLIASLYLCCLNGAIYYSWVEAIFWTFFRRTLEHKQSRAQNDLYNVIYHNDNALRFARSPIGKILSYSILLSAGYVILRKGGSLLRRLKKRISSETGMVEILRNIEIERYGAGSTFKRVPTSTAKVWNVQQPVTRSTPHTGSIESLDACVIRNTRYARLRSNGKTYHFYILGIKDNAFITNKHNLQGLSEGILKISMTDGIHVNSNGWTKVSFDETNTLDMGNDLFMIRGTLRFRDISKHFPESIDSVGSTGLFAGTKTFVTLVDETSTAWDESSHEYVTLDRFLSYSHSDHKKGMCGLPVLQSTGKGASILGIHYAGNDGSTDCLGRPITRGELEVALSRVPAVFVYATESGLFDTHLGDPGIKSATRFEFLQNLQYFGKTPGPVILDNRSGLVEVPFGDTIRQYFETNHGVKPTLYGRPLMRAKFVGGDYINPYNICLRNMAGDRKSLKPRILNQVVSILTKRFIDGLPDDLQLKPCTIQEAINGVEEDCFIRRINVNTSSGFGFSGQKHSHLPLVDETTREPTESLAEVIYRRLQEYESGGTCKFIYTAKLKDEPRTIEKCLTGKTRVFFMGPLDSLILSRMFLTPFYTLMIEYNELFCTAVGIDMHRGSDDLYNRIVSFSENIFEGDYGNYDQIMPLGVGDAVNAIIMNVLQHFGYEDGALKVTRGILTDNLCPYIEVLKDVFGVPGLQPSGKFATAEDNSLRGLILLLYCWIDNGFDGDFFESFLPVTYGDDILGSSREPRFNAAMYADYVEKVYGMTFTDSTKSKVTQPFITPQEMSFLKRKFIRHSEFEGRFMAYLEPSSMIRALSWNLPSQHISESVQMKQTCISILWEYAIYCPSRYSNFRQLLIELMHTTFCFPLNELEKDFPRFRFIESSILGDTGDDVLGPEYKEDSPYLRTERHFVTESNTTRDKGKNGIADHKDTIRLMLKEYQEEYDSLITVIDECKEIQILLMQDRSITEISHIDGIEEKYITCLHRLEDVAVTIDRLNDLLRPNRRFITQSGEVSSGTIDIQNRTLSENFVDVTGGAITEESGGKSSQPRTGQKQSLEPGDFWARPIEVDTFTLPAGSFVNKKYEIWDVWSSAPTVRAKLRNYSYFNGTLHVRFAISASPFHSGRNLVSYQPMATSNKPLQVLETANASWPGMYKMLINYKSQSRGAVSMDVKSNTPVEIECPFIFTMPMARLFGGNAVLASGSPYPDLAKLGQVHFDTITPVASVGTSPTSVRVQILVWATDVDLGSPTGTQIAITTESGEVDEFETGPVERWASRLTEISGALVQVPYITPYAYASKMLFSSIGKFASIFGWSKPVVIDEPMIVKQQLFMNGCQGIGYDTTMRLTFDPKQELSVDPRVCGVSEDEMTIRSISSKVSYVDSFNWLDTDTVMQPVYYLRNSVMQETIDTSATHQYIQPTAMAFAAKPWTYWNGTIKYRFEIVATLFHRGKIGILFEPNIEQAALINLNLGTNKQHMIVVDIQETQVFEVCVDWAQPRQWCTTAYPPVVSHGTTLNVTQPESTNGYLSIFPFTQLQSPDGSGITVNVYACCEDLNVNLISQRGMNMTRKIRTESGVVPAEDLTCLTINPNDSDLKESSVHHFGESPVSYRMCMKRFITCNTIAGGASPNAVGKFTGSFPVFPANILPYGATTLAVPMDLFSYLRYAYLGNKGGIRKRVHILCTGSLLSQCWSKFTLGTPTLIDPVSTVTLSTTPSRDSINGTVAFANSVNGGFEAEFPFYSPNLFSLSFADDQVGDMANMLPWTRFYLFELEHALTNANVIIDESAATGEDFTFLRFQGSPYYTLAL